MSISKQELQPGNDHNDCGAEAPKKLYEIIPTPACRRSKKKRSRSRKKRFRGCKERLRLKRDELKLACQEAMEDNTILRQKETELEKKNLKMER